jgi:hypothetical protein
LLGRLAVELLADVPDVEARGVRLCGVSASGFERPSTEGGAVRGAQLGFEALLRPSSPAPATPIGEKLGHTVDEIRRRFGETAIRRAVHLAEED